MVAAGYLGRKTGGGFYTYSSAVPPAPTFRGLAAEPAQSIQVEDGDAAVLDRQEASIFQGF